VNSQDWFIIGGSSAMLMVTLLAVTNVATYPVACLAIAALLVSYVTVLNIRRAVQRRRCHDAKER
jgi:hypothetical protein